MYFLANNSFQTTKVGHVFLIRAKFEVSFSLTSIRSACDSIPSMKIRFGYALKLLFRSSTNRLAAVCHAANKENLQEVTCGRFNNTIRYGTICRDISLLKIRRVPVNLKHRLCDRPLALLRKKNCKCLKQHIRMTNLTSRTDVRKLHTRAYDLECLMLLAVFSNIFGLKLLMSA